VLSKGLNIAESLPKQEASYSTSVVINELQSQKKLPPSGRVKR